MLTKTISETNPEEARLAAASLLMPYVLPNSKSLDAVIGRVAASQDYERATRVISESGLELWNQTVQQVQAGALDDRPLYWQRLYINRGLRTTAFHFEVSNEQREALVELHETSSRGQSSLKFSQTDNGRVKRVVVSGFDPFLLDKNLQQVNPSGIVALALDGKVFETSSGLVEVQTVMMPVRYGDFDAGELEHWLAPVYRDNLADMVVTVSMGREHFDLERFPGLRRSATVPGNLNVVTGASPEKPLIPTFPAEYAASKEFVEFSLPYNAMMTVTGDYQVNLNALVTTLEKGEFVAENLEQLKGQTAVRGGGGGYLSNEISYRSINLRNHLGSTIPTGHIHTPRIANADPAPIEAIVKQTEAMILRAAEALKPGT